jgi:hypothetical protein
MRKLLGCAVAMLMAGCTLAVPAPPPTEKAPVDDVEGDETKAPVAKAAVATPDGDAATAEEPAVCSLKGSCTMTSEKIGTVCLEYEFTGARLADVRADCIDNANFVGTWSVERCSRKTMVAGCAIVSKLDEACPALRWFKYPPASAEDAHAACANSGGKQL